MVSAISRQKTLRMIGEPRARYREDPVRMLRAVRLAAELGLSIDPEARRPIREMASLLVVWWDDLFDEMLKLLTSGHAVKCITQLRDEGLHHGLLPLLDVILEQPMGERFVMLALANTDYRLSAAKALRPVFLRHPAWHEVLAHWKSSSRPAKQRFQRSFRRWTRYSMCRAKNSPSPAALPATSRKSGHCSRASSNGPASAPTPCSSSLASGGLRFPALACPGRRNASDIADGWTRFQSVDGEDRAQMLLPVPADEKKRRRRRKKPLQLGLRHQRMSLAYLARANLGDPVATLAAAFTALEQLPASTLLRRSSLYRTAPIGLTAQPDFINAAASLSTTLMPHDLLQALQAIEQAFGRRRDIHNGPRTLDLDLLLYDTQEITSPQLCVPHPRLHLRAFVLQPLAESLPT